MTKSVIGENKEGQIHATMPSDMVRDIDRVIAITNHRYAHRTHFVVTACQRLLEAEKTEISSKGGKLDEVRLPGE